MTKNNNINDKNIIRNYYSATTTCNNRTNKIGVNSNQQ